MTTNAPALPDSGTAAPVREGRPAHFSDYLVMDSTCKESSRFNTLTTMRNILNITATGYGLLAFTAIGYLVYAIVNYPI